MGKATSWTSVSDLSGEDVFDSRDVEALIDELQDRADDEDKTNPLDEDEAELLKAAIEVRDDCGSEWRHGVGFIRETHWRDYCEEMASDLGYVQSSRKDNNPLMDCIDWDKWAGLVAQDYSTVEIDGVTFYYRD